MRRIPAHRLKNLNRRLRRLSEGSEVAWRVHFGKECTEEVIERFLGLEHMGWKGEKGTSLRSNERDEQFFKAMIARFRDANAVFFTELVHDGVVIASTCNLVSGNTAFGFKIGWNPGFAKYSPGMLNELALLERCHDIVARFDLVDSGSMEGAYIDELWPDKREIVSGTFMTTRVGRTIGAMAAARRRARAVTAGIYRTVSHAWRTLWQPRQDGPVRPVKPRPETKPVGRYGGARANMPAAAESLRRESAEAQYS